jgi:hypothetical protein
MGPATMAWLCLGAACTAGCAAGAPVPTLESVTPSRGYTDQPLRVVIRGDGFIPSFRLDPTRDARRGDASGFTGQVGTGSDAVKLHDFDWLDTTRLTAWMDPGLPRGLQPIEIRDPRGQSVGLSGGFLSLGPDHDKPAVWIERPVTFTAAAPGTTLKATAGATEPGPGALAEVRWQTRGGGEPLSARSCPLTPSPTEVRCDFDISIPSSMMAGEVFEIEVEALDRAAVPNRGTASVSLTLRDPPAIESVEPARGGVAGGSDVVVTGSGFLPGSRLLVEGVLLAPDGGTVIDEHTISGRMPPHPTARVALELRTPLGDSKLPLAFEYLEPPAIHSIAPDGGDPAGGTPVRIVGERFTADTQVLLGDSLTGAVPLAAPELVSDTVIRGLTPPGTGRASVWVVDSATGWDRLVDGYGWTGP